MKGLLGIDLTDNAKDSILNHFLNKAREIILGYCNVTELSDAYEGTIVDFAVYLYKNRDSVGIIKRTEGEKGVTYEEGIPELIRLSLPLPRIKVGY